MDRATFAAFTVLNHKLNRVLTILGDEVMAELDALNDAAARLETAADTIITKLEQIKAQGGIDPAAVQAVTDRLQAVSDRLTAAAA
jgi:phage-related minor tail protein